MTTRPRLVVVSNRTPSLAVARTEEERRAQSAGGLVSAVRAALEEVGGIWFGWSGHTVERRVEEAPSVAMVGSIQLVSLDLTRDEVAQFYTVFANQSLWPLLHSFPSRARIRREAYRIYRRVNRRFATGLFSFLREGDLVWVHDYHLIPLGHELRRLGWRGRMGFFLHTPFPPPEVIGVLPWARDLLEALMSYDLVGVHTQRYLRNLRDTVALEFEGVGPWADGGTQESLPQGAVFPIGTEPDLFERWAKLESRSGAAKRALRRTTPSQQIVLGVDRLDYTKGIPLRLRAFERLLEHYPSLRARITMVQISVPSRTRVPEYIEEKNTLERLVGQINGRFADAGWVPIQYLYRSYTQRELAGFYREADVCLVTPLRDGMNLVAKEFVASQGENPGVLVLSKFSGAAETMHDALIVNPYDVDGTAEALYQALSMSERERRRRFAALRQAVRAYDVHAWRDAFLTALAVAPEPRAQAADRWPAPV